MPEKLAKKAAREKRKEDAKTIGWFGITVWIIALLLVAVLVSYFSLKEKVVEPKMRAPVPWLTSCSCDLCECCNACRIDARYPGARSRCLCKENIGGIQTIAPLECNCCGGCPCFADSCCH